MFPDYKCRSKQRKTFRFRSSIKTLDFVRLPKLKEKSAAHPKEGLNKTYQLQFKKSKYYDY